MDERLGLGAWAGRCARVLLPIFEAARPGDSRPRDALNALDDWVAGKVNLTVVRPLILAAHAAARDAIADGHEAAGYAARAAAQAASAVHMSAHATGPVYYAGRIGPEAKEQLLTRVSELPPNLRRRVRASL